LRDEKGKEGKEREEEEEERMMSNDESYPSQWVCLPDEAGHCVTCSDEALPARVLKIDFEQYLALVALEGSTEEVEVDISLVEPVECGEMLLVHGGVALGRLTEESRSRMDPVPGPGLGQEGSRK
jgi:hydrogenase maturation factor